VISLAVNGAAFHEIVIYSQGGAAEFYVDAVNLGSTAAPLLGLSSISPASGPVGTTVTITGTGFGATQGTSTVAFNGTPATPTTWSATSIQAVVPAGATTGNVVVTVGSQSSNGLSFTVSSSVITNPSFELGSSSPVSFTGSKYGGSSAATGWPVWNNLSGTTTTELCTATACPSGSTPPAAPIDGVSTLHVTTTAASSGVYQLFPKATLTSGSLWLHVVSGTVLAYLLGPGGTVAQETSSTGVIWLPANGAIFNEIVIYSQGGAAEFYVDAVEIAP
jgi:hypothetical protein